MLIEFQVTNFRSFRATQTLSMVASNFSEHLDTHSFESGLPGFGRFLRSSVVYGANAAGKTNLLRALQFMQALVLSSATAAPATAMPYDPFKFSKSSRQAPSEFQVTFVQDRTRYEYGFKLTAQRVQEEWLIQYVHTRGREIFERIYNPKTEKYDWTFSKFLKGQRSVWSESTRPNALFLSTAIQLNSEQLLPVFEWFQKRLVVIVGITTMNATLTLQLLNTPNGKERVLPFLHHADRLISNVDLVREPIQASGSPVMLLGGNPIIEQLPGQGPNLIKISLAHHTADEEDVPLDLAEESAGTQVLFRSAGAWLNVIDNGEVLLFDEIDTSLHPVLTKFLIEKFHSNDTNPKNAQLIFSTHNTTLLDLDLFRRDQIWFVERDEGGSSTLYPLTNFKPRNDEVIESWYMRGRYGALPVLIENHR